MGHRFRTSGIAPRSRYCGVATSISRRRQKRRSSTKRRSPNNRLTPSDVPSAPIVRKWHGNRAHRETASEARIQKAPEGDWTSHPVRHRLYSCPRLCRRERCRRPLRGRWRAPGLSRDDLRIRLARRASCTDAAVRARADRHRLAGWAVAISPGASGKSRVGNRLMCRMMSPRNGTDSTQFSSATSMRTRFV